MLGNNDPFQFILEVLDGVKVRAACRTDRVLSHQTGKNLSFMDVACFVYGGIVMLEQERTFSKLLPQLGAHYYLK